MTTRLSPDALASAFGFLDVGDVPVVARVSKEWNGALKDTEDAGDGLFLTLIRKYHPCVEKITAMLPDDIGEAPPEGGGDDNVPPPAKRSRKEPGRSGISPSSAAGGNGIPPPSKNWRRQLQRARMLSRVIPTIPENPGPDPKSLSAYYVQVDFILYKKIKSKPGIFGTQVGIVSRILEDITFSKDEVVLPFKGGDELSKHTGTFSTVVVKVTLFERCTGKQSELYEGFCDDICESCWMFGTFLALNPKGGAFRHSHMTELPQDSLPRVGCSGWLLKTGCVCNCPGVEDWNIFNPPRSRICDSCKSCGCCSCEEKWQCIYDVEMSLEFKLFHYYCDDFEELTKRQQLQFFESLDFV